MLALRAEFQKAKRRHDLFICLLVPLAAALWSNGAAKAHSSAALLYSVPIMNAVLMPVAMALLSSRLWDIEIKSDAPKLLCTLQSRESLFFAKAAFGIGEVALTCMLETALLPALCADAAPPAQLAYFFVCTLTVSVMLFFSGLLLTLWFSTPAPALCVGIAGALVGLFSAFMPAFVSYLVPWGYYIPLGSYILTDWNRETRATTYGTRAFNWPLLAWTVFLALALFALTYRAAQEKEV